VGFSKLQSGCLPYSRVSLLYYSTSSDCFVLIQIVYTLGVVDVGDGAVPPPANHERHGGSAGSGAVSATAFGRVVDDGDPEHGGPSAAFESPGCSHPCDSTMPRFVIVANDSATFAKPDS